jgi:hypothetical protein
MVIGVLGGTGPQGRGLAVRLAATGQRILLGSRDADGAADVASQVAGRARRAAAVGVEVSVGGGANVDVAGVADLVIVAVPFDAHAATLADLVRPLADKIVVDCVVPMAFDDDHRLAAHADDQEGGHAQTLGKCGEPRQCGGLQVDAHAPRQRGDADTEPVPPGRVPFHEFAGFEGAQQSIGDRAVQADPCGDVHDRLRGTRGGQVLQDPDPPVQRL